MKNDRLIKVGQVRQVAGIESTHGNKYVVLSTMQEESLVVLKFLDGYRKDEVTEWMDLDVQEDIVVM